jgi:hypothetical protein
MADDDLLEDDAEFDEELDVDDLDESEIDEDLDDVVEDESVVDFEDDAVADAEDEVEEAAHAEPGARVRKKRDDEDDDEDELDPDDVEADLDTILKDRIAASDDDDEDEELEEADARAASEVADGVQPRKANEFMCPGCFLLVSPAQFGPPGRRECPVGEEVCPGIDIVAEQQHARKA